MRLEFTVTAGGGVPNGGRCRLHGRPCATPWGWDLAHADSPRRPLKVIEMTSRVA